MDPNAAFWESVVRDLVVWAVAAVFIERALYQVFDTNLWERIESRIESMFGPQADPKPWISVAVSLWVVVSVDFDIFRTLFGYAESITGTLILTGLAVAGGATGAYKALERIRAIRDSSALQKITRDHAIANSFGKE